MRWRVGLAERVVQSLRSEFLPQGAGFTPTAQDVMLVSYPKSGNTWVRALVTHLIRSEPTLGEMDRLVPDVYTSSARVLRRAHRFPCSGRLIKSHEGFQPSYKRVVYLVRDPRDVCVSYYHYLGNILRTFDPSSTGLDGFLELFISGQADPYGTWGDHVRGWLSADGPDLLLIKYEELLADPAACLKRVCTFLQLDIDASSTSAAIRDCSIGNLQSKERRERSTWHMMKKANRSAAFFRAGGTGHWKDLDEKLLEKMYELWGGEMRTLGYLV